MPRAPKGLLPGQVTGQHGIAGKAVKIKPGHAHRHGCVQCGMRYDDACQTPDENGRCNTCRTGRPRVPWVVSMDPAPCCKIKNATRQMTYDERARYACATTLIWYQCRTCARTHPYDPYDPTATTPEGAS